jgi:hypothetical protein
MKNPETIRNTSGYLPCPEAGQIRDAFGKCIKVQKPHTEPKSTQSKDDELDLSRDLFPAPRTVRAYNQAEAYRHDANLAANSASIERSLTHAPTIYRTIDSGDAVIKTSNHFGSEYVTIDTYADVGLTALANNRSDQTEDNPIPKPFNPIPTPPIPVPTPTPTPVDPCKGKKPPTLSPSSKNITPGGCITITTNTDGKGTIDVEDNYDNDELTINETDDGIQLCLSPGAVNTNCEKTIKVSVTDSCGKTTSTNISPTSSSTYTAFYEIWTEGSIFGPQYPYEGGGCAAVHQLGYCWSICAMQPVNCAGEEGGYLYYTCGDWSNGSYCSIDSPEWPSIMYGMLASAPGKCPPYDVRTPAMIMAGCCPSKE